MLDIIDGGSGSDKPTWEDIEFTIQFHIKSICNQCSHTIKHTTCFVGDGSNVTEILALTGNKKLQIVITNIIAELIAADPVDISFKQFIKRLKLRIKNYERVTIP